MTTKLTGLVAATHSPFLSNGDLNLAAVDKQAEHLAKSGINAVFICGTTGESHSLTVDERLALATRWGEVVRGTQMRLVVHVGTNCLADGRRLAKHAQSLGAFAIAALAPSHFKPKTLDTLIACSAEIAAAAPELPFYYYDIPSLTGVQLPTSEYLVRAPEKIPTLAGVKFTNTDLMSYQKCLHVENGKFDLPWGVDEYLLSALAVGAVGAVGSSYNFAAPLYQRIWSAFSRGDLATAQAEQYRSVQLIELLNSFGYVAAAKAVMGMLGVDVGPARLPNANLLPEQYTQLRAGLDKLGFFDWILA